MIDFKKAYQSRLLLKMKLVNYAWYNSSSILFSKENDYFINVLVKKVDDQVRKIIPSIINDVVVRIEIDK